MSSPPAPETITPSQLAYLLSIYPVTLEKAYKLNTRLKDPKKLSGALEDDRWRYDQLPRILAARRAVGKEGEKGEGAPWLEKAELERLVGWKITHGTHRPFLPSLIRQNSPELIQSTTQSAFSSIRTPAHTLPPQEHIPYPKVSTSLTTLTKPLKGVGPATGTLLLSVYHPDTIPFFSDELYAWLVLQRQQADTREEKAKMKLKYDMKEYQRLYEAWADFREGLGLRGYRKVKAVEVEKVAFVVGWWHLLDEEEKRLVNMGEGGHEAQDKDEKHDEVLGEGSDDAERTKWLRLTEGIKGKGTNEGNANAGKSGDGLVKTTLTVKVGDEKVVSVPRKEIEMKRERQPVNDEPTIRRSKRLKRS
ncbi:hypothetical protein EPUS_05971 [Endocarpon pusillum Z07020]|uniref:Uncharacterized protein n=1 Tax=Endocarpon pusillum (strain Z07020 / HMAS-L-300199) TaxID=1263415 RepID=U1G1N4_ENDPU|nr:uncharacterized protein EPUS_05971 [Endocarpon pusillum Z07020]ERF71142.1 hypothetical protein EPUS_05971 [Endocarpon pusillum Z07020]